MIENLYKKLIGSKRQQQISLKSDYIKIWFASLRVVLAEEKWCDENLSNNYILYSDVIYVKTEEDMMAFKLRWM